LAAGAKNSRVDDVLSRRFVSLLTRLGEASPEKDWEGARAGAAASDIVINSDNDKKAMRRTMSSRDRAMRRR
jgi:hypothetical protein